MHAFCPWRERDAWMPVFAAKFASKGGCTGRADTVEGVKEKPLQTAVKGKNGHGVLRMGGGPLIGFLFASFADIMAVVDGDLVFG